MLNHFNSPCCCHYLTYFSMSHHQEYPFSPLRASLFFSSLAAARREIGLLGWDSMICISAKNNFACWCLNEDLLDLLPVVSHLQGNSVQACQARSFPYKLLTKCLAIELTTFAPGLQLHLPSTCLACKHMS
jgi:hypothetical protein